MKTVVLGLFDDPEAALQALLHVARSPLEVSAIHVVHRDRAIQQRLEQAAGLHRHRGPLAMATAGAVLGAAVAVLTVTSLSWSHALGPLLAASAGLLCGALLGVLLGILSSSVRLPGDGAEEAARAVDAGATALIFETEKLPTARAIGQLLEASGCRLPAESRVDDTGPEAGVGASGTFSSVSQEDHSPFLPPSQRPPAVSSPLPPPPSLREPPPE